MNGRQRRRKERGRGKKKKKEDDERIRRVAEATAAQQTSGASGGSLLRMPAEAEGIKSLRAYEKLSPNEKAAYQLGQQSMARPAPKASGSKKGKGKAKEAPLPDPCMVCVAAKAQHECVTQQDAKNAVACNRCRHKKLQCSWRSSKGPDLSLVEIEEQLGRMADVQEETLAWTKRLVGAIEEANELRRMKMKYPAEVTTYLLKCLIIVDTGIAKAVDSTLTILFLSPGLLLGGF
ncbi:hypothetical protein MPER_13044 [Moniliophthora perniciosa FA553]|nr:hypothetical protein MPER_13044 [Moniliophthora perniciosa FA553]